jgi:DNA polymerase III delta' subunit
LERALKKGTLGIVGNDAIQDRLHHYLKGKRIHPACILTGPAGTGKLQLAKNIAKHILCPNQKQGPFCDQCSTCRRIDKDLHPDILVCKEEGEDVIKIDTVRDLCHQMALTPVEGSAKICIVDECHRLNVASANAFLKTLEEPGPQRYFWLLTTQIGSLLPTILSRCLKFRLPPLPENAKVQPETSQLIDSIQLLWEQAIQSGDSNALIAALDKKEKAQALISLLQRNLHTQIMNDPESAESFLQLERFERAVETEGRLRSNANYGLMLDSFLIQNYFDRQ